GPGDLPPQLARLVRARAARPRPHPRPLPRPPRPPPRPRRRRRGGGLRRARAARPPRPPPPPGRLRRERGAAAAGGRRGRAPHRAIGLCRGPAPAGDRARLGPVRPPRCLHRPYRLNDRRSGTTRRAATPPVMLATYRLQLLPAFGFAEVEALLPYFARLGVSHLYLSPITEARAGSTHGYDVVDHNAVRADYGGRAGLDRLLDAAHARGLGVIFDWVPNHAGVGPRNDAWQDVLAYGP